MAARAALILSGAGCVLPSVSSGIAVLAGTLRLKYICPRGSIAAFAFGSRLSFFLCQEKRDGLRYAPFLFCRVEIAFVRSRSVGAVICLCGFTSGLCVSLWRSRRVTGMRRTGIRGRWRGLCAFLRSRIGVAALSAGSTLGLRAPNLRQRVECGSGTAASLDSLHLIRGVGAFYAAGTVREHSAVSWRCRQLPRRRLSASSPRAGTAPRPDNTPQPFRRRCTPHAQPARRRGSATAQRPRRTARLP